MSQRYVNLSKIPKSSYLGLRVTTMLIGRPIIAIPGKYLKLRATTQTSNVDGSVPSYLLDPDPAKYDLFLAWTRKSGVKYYLYQPPVSAVAGIAFSSGVVCRRGRPASR